MSDAFAILNLGKRALITQQTAINVTGNNIANANTPGYSLQRVNMTTNEPISVWPGQLGTGVKASEVERIYDRFLMGQINNQNQSMERWGAQKSALERVEMVLDESSGNGLSVAMNEFWNAWQDLADNPTGHVERMSLLAKAETMATIFNQAYADLQQIQKDIDTSIEGTIDSISPILEQIAELNQKITQTEVSGQNANDYRDRRDLLLKELSSLVDINTFEDDSGKVSVLVSGGRPLVEIVRTWDLSTQLNASGLKDILWDDGTGTTVNITSDINGGKLKGWLQVRDVIIPDLLSRLDDLANGIMQQVNSLHSAGYTLDPGNPTGIDFFTGTSASDIAVDSSVVSDINLIAASGTLGGVPGDNSNAIAIANLQDDLLMSGNEATFGDFFTSLVSDVGVEVQRATMTYDHQISMVTQLENYRETVSGVSLDEEMVNLIKFQHAYDAAAKLITTTDEILNTLINMV
jgi:flagellar hook-associated protein 1 FlgK